MNVMQLAEQLARNYANQERTAIHNVEAHLIIEELNRRDAAVVAHITWIGGYPQRIVNIIFDGDLIRTFEPADQQRHQLHEKRERYATRPTRYRISHHSQETTCAQCAEPLYVGAYAHEVGDEVFCSTTCANRYL
ncbi:MAG: hypothetical protein DCC55_39190, partial [Chloroflexi bacterium]